MLELKAELKDPSLEPVEAAFQLEKSQWLQVWNKELRIVEETRPMSFISPFPQRTFKAPPAFPCPPLDLLLVRRL